MGKRVIIVILICLVGVFVLGGVFVLTKGKKVTPKQEVTLKPVGGKLQWYRAFGGEWHDGPLSVQQTSDGGYLIVGTTESYGAGGEDIWLIKVKEIRK